MTVWLLLPGLVGAAPVDQMAGATNETVAWWQPVRAPHDDALVWAARVLVPAGGTVSGRLTVELNDSSAGGVISAMAALVIDGDVGAWVGLSGGGWDGRVAHLSAAGVRVQATPVEPLATGAAAELVLPFGPLDGGADFTLLVGAIAPSATVRVTVTSAGDSPEISARLVDDALLHAWEVHQFPRGGAAWTPVASAHLRVAGGIESRGTLLGWFAPPSSVIDLPHGCSSPENAATCHSSNGVEAPLLFSTRPGVWDFWAAAGADVLPSEMHVLFALDLPGTALQPPELVA